MHVVPALFFSTLTGFASSTNPTGPQRTPDDLRREVVRGHAEWCHRVYAACARRAEALDESVKRFAAAPSESGLEAARAAWIHARRVYGLSEALRFCDGPIEAVEPSLNAWPIDEAYIDSVVGRPDSGIVNDAARFPQIGSAVLRVANERGGETNISIGWHAVEFMLFGQDHDPDGPGRRPWTDFVEGRAKNAVRRAEYLRAVTSLLPPTLTDLANAWTPDSAHGRREFESDPATAIRKMFTGAIVLTSFELHGERLGVAYETKDQEQEHSCFSDTSHLDLQANQAGIVAIFAGEHDGVRHGPGLTAYVRVEDAAVADDVQAKLARTTEALRAIPAPFDRAMRGPDDGAGRLAIRAALDALAEQTDAIAVAGRKLGLTLPLEPGG